MDSEFQKQVKNLKSISERLNSIELIQLPLTQLIQLLEEKKYTQVMHHVIHIFGLLLKFHVLLNLAIYIDNEKMQSKLHSAYDKLLGQNALGNWKQIADNIKKILEKENITDDHIEALIIIIDSYSDNKKDIIKWRNSIAHGGLISAENETNALIGHIEQLGSIYEDNSGYYNSLSSISEGSEVIFNFTSASSISSIRVSPFIINYKDQLYLYEKFDPKHKDNKNTEYLEYLKEKNDEQRYKTYQDLIQQIYLRVKNTIYLEQANASAEEELYLETEENT